MIESNVIVVNGLAYKAIKPVDAYCTSCDLRDKKCWEMPKTNSCIPENRVDGEYVNYKKLKVTNYKFKE